MDMLNNINLMAWVDGRNNRVTVNCRSTEEYIMGQTYSRKATFVVTKVNGQRVFTPVNKRGRTVAKKLGKRTKITLAELKSTVGKGSYKFYAYGQDGILKAIRF